jgi:hypothetical protein
MLLAALVGWLSQRQQDAVAYLIEENRILRVHVRGRLRLTDEERRRLAMLGHRLGRRRLRDVATIVTPDTILRWHPFRFQMTPWLVRYLSPNAVSITRQGTNRWSNIS